MTTLAKLLPWANVAYIVLVALGSYGIYQLTSRANADKDRELAKYQADASVQIKQAESKAIEAEARAAEANAVAEQAKLELARLKQPRSIPSEHKAQMVALLGKYAGQSYSYRAFDDSETQALLGQIDEVLQQAKWIEVSPSRKVVLASGVSVYIGQDYPEGKDVLLALCGSLAQIGIPCTPNRDPEWRGKTIVIVVGRKPLS